ncbi:hypothetical protein MAMT_01940 [Methylacidimicrobium tartarophylax]|uniref:Uncharacterized protein n=1 Tax=Methylacidimicrobium tartarophylax TaxID=1041768 RepID=A0A5E6MQE6_9BACT|nr:hypothetical protein MAMT_01940 [Methylacidimicrobium tartarophylax]
MPIHSSGDILAALREHPEWKKELLNAFLSDPVETEEIRNRLLSRELIELPGKFARAEESRKSDVHTLLDLFQKGEEARQKDSKAVWEAIGRLTERVDRLTIRMDQLTERFEAAEEARRKDSKAVWEAIGKLTERVDRLTIRMDQLIEQVSKLAERTEIHEVSIADLKGKFLEFSVRQDPEDFVYAIAEDISRVKRGQLEDILAAASSVITPQEAKAVRALDFCLSGKRQGKGVFLAVEASCAIGKDDVERASARSAILAKAVAVNPRLARIPVLPVVIGDGITQDAREAARDHKVWTVIGEDRETTPGGR